MCDSDSTTGSLHFDISGGNVGIARAVSCLADDNAGSRKGDIARDGRDSSDGGSDSGGKCGIDLDSDDKTAIVVPGTISLSLSNSY